LVGIHSVDGNYERLEAHGVYWTASESDSITAPFYNFGKGSQALYRQPQGEKKRAMSVRCVRESPQKNCDRGIERINRGAARARHPFAPMSLTGSDRVKSLSGDLTGSGRSRSQQPPQAEAYVLNQCLDMTTNPHLPPPQSPRFDRLGRGAQIRRCPSNLVV
jgi:hypothetical protein